MRNNTINPLAVRVIAGMLGFNSARSSFRAEDSGDHLMFKCDETNWEWRSVCPRATYLRAVMLVNRKVRNGYHADRVYLDTILDLAHMCDHGRARLYR